MDESNDPNDQGFAIIGNGDRELFDPSKGFAIVGEPGPELFDIPPGSTIYPNPTAPLTYDLRDHSNVIGSLSNNASGSTVITYHLNVPQATSITLWNEQLQVLRSPIHIEGTYEPTDFTQALFQAIDIAQSITWHAVKPWRKYSNQTRAWYRVRARAQHRRKFVVYSHGGHNRHDR